jgi:hypothetical protein
MYSFLLIIHNLFRWIVIILALYAIYNNYSGWRKGIIFSKKDRTLNTIFVGTLHLQLLLGLILYFGFSDYVSMAMGNMKAAMKDPILRFWGVEHITGMVIAIAIAQIGSIVSKKAATNPEKFRKAFVYFLIAFIIIILSHPFSFHGESRPMNPLDHAESVQAGA